MAGRFDSLSGLAPAPDLQEALAPPPGQVGQRIRQLVAQAQKITGKGRPLAGQRPTVAPGLPHLASILYELSVLAKKL